MRLTAITSGILTFTQKKLKSRNDFSNLSNSEIVDASVFALKEESEVFDREEMRDRRVKLRRVMLQTSQKLLQNVALVKTVIN